MALLMACRAVWREIIITHPLPESATVDVYPNSIWVLAQKIQINTNSCNGRVKVAVAVSSLRGIPIALTLENKEGLPKKYTGNCSKESHTGAREDSLLNLKSGVHLRTRSGKPEITQRPLSQQRRNSSSIEKHRSMCRGSRTPIWRSEWKPICCKALWIVSRFGRPYENFPTSVCLNGDASCAMSTSKNSTAGSP